MAVTYRSEWVKCGKDGCRRCPHGPYWYAYWKEGGKLKKKYIGKKLPEAKEEGPKKPEKPDYRDAILSGRTATLELAWELLGVEANASYEVCRSAYRQLAKDNHPDRGGDSKVSARLSCAWAYLRVRHGWR